MQYDDTAPGYGNVNPTRNTLGSLRPEFSELTFEVLHMRFAHLLQADILNGFHETDDACLQSRRQSLDFGIDSVECFNTPSHICYIANRL